MVTLIVIAVVCVGLMKAWRRVPDSAKAEGVRALRRVRLMTGEYSLEHLMAHMIDEALRSVVVSVSRSYMPNILRYGLHPEDAKRWGQFFPALEQELASLLQQEVKQRRDLALAGGTVSVLLFQDPTAQPGRPTFVAQIAPRSGDADHDGETVLAAV